MCDDTTMLLKGGLLCAKKMQCVLLPRRNLLPGEYVGELSRAALLMRCAETVMDSYRVGPSVHVPDTKYLCCMTGSKTCTLVQCAKLCQQKDGCHYFAYGVGSKKGT